MRNFLIEENLKKTLIKISKKDKSMYNAVMKKFEEILISKDVNHYKNLKKPLQGFKRVHIKSSFVLIFRYIESDDKIVFFNIAHHDDIY